MQLAWHKNFKDNGGLIELDRLDLSKVKTNGVYVLYLKGNPPSCVYVGKGDVAERLGCHKTDAQFANARKLGSLCVAFAEVAASDQEGVETYLAKLHPPMCGDRHPDVAEIQVNSPFAA